MLQTVLTLAQIILEVGLRAHVAGEKTKFWGEAGVWPSSLRAGVLFPGVSAVCILRPRGKGWPWKKHWFLSPGVGWARATQEDGSRS